ncbi:hypothetical protein [Streptomyces sp. TP-A0356]|uniref:hypothetical protein n=1 Tax=Streptomyces sp. TP-A0356 TaxID=1359208 RepID=UPI0006E17A41|nr:hypothetical protein [Streptomyces sp. TP-A0356]
MAMTTAAVALGALPFTAPTPAFAASHSVSLTVGPVPVPHVPLSACIDTTCVSTPPLNSVTLSTTATVNGPALPILTPAPCPNGGRGAAIRISSLTPTTVTISGSVSGTSSSGQVNIPLGPVTETITPGTPGVLVSACTT